MTSDQIADSVVAHLNATTAKPIQFEAVKPATVAEAEAESASYGVFVLPYAESEVPFDNGFTCKRERVVSIVVNGPINDLVDRAKAMEFSEFVRTALEGTEFDGYLWSGNETVSLYDAEVLRTKNKFLSLARATYFTIA